MLLRLWNDKGLTSGHGNFISKDVSVLEECKLGCCRSVPYDPPEHWCAMRVK